MYMIMSKYYISIEHTEDIDTGQYAINDPDILIKKRSFLIFDMIVKNFGTYNRDLKEYADRYCKILNSVSL